MKGFIARRRQQSNKLLNFHLTFKSATMDYAVNHRSSVRIPAVLMFLIILTGCSRTPGENSSAKVDSVKQTSSSYAPGLGEFMTSIQIHHAKLWFAGQAQNWELANFEVHEILEALDDIKNFNSDRPESKSIDMIQPALDSVNRAIVAMDVKQFSTSFTSLTQGCNGCHRATHHAFNVVKIPDAPPFSNQDFRLTK